MITLKDIAKEAGVSVMTVSRVVNGHLSKVSEEKARRIQEIIREKNYIPNSTARSLSSKSSHIVSLIIGGKGNQLSNPYNAAIAGEIIPLVQERGYYLMLHFVDRYDDITQRLRAWNAEGAIFLGTFDEDIQKIIFNNQIPLVFTDSYSPVRQITNVGIDDYKGGVLAASHFIEMGHTSFAYLGWSLTSNVVNNRLNGFRDTLINAGFSLPSSHIFEAQVNIDQTAASICALLDRPTAIFISADMLAIELINYFIRHGYSVPADYSIIGFDDLAMGHLITPSLTTIVQDIPRKAKIATDLLFRHIQDPSTPAENITLDVQLIQRESVCRI
jgi:LacI family transcriptional regulator